MDLDKLFSKPNVCRIQYGRDKTPPNDHCYWDDEYEVWMEFDAHFRNRIISKIATENGK